MCLICLDIERENLTVFEALDNLSEMRTSLGDHAAEVDEVISAYADRLLDEAIEEEEFTPTPVRVNLLGTPKPKVDLTWNPLNSDDEVWIPVRDQDDELSERIDTIEGLTMDRDLDELDDDALEAIGEFIDWMENQYDFQSFPLGGPSGPLWGSGDE